MPDNLGSGKLEDFLRGLIDDRDPLIDHAESATDEAKRLGAVFTESDRVKAVVNAWLAWQEVPGQTFGDAMKSQYFRHDNPPGMALVRWYSNLFRVQPAR